MIYINVTNTFTAKGKTGIQRVVKEVVSKTSHRDDIRFMAWCGDGFYDLNSSEGVASILGGEVGSYVPDEKINLHSLARGDTFFDIDASWHDAYDVSQLFRGLKERGIVIVKIHYDAVPILFPEYAHPNTVFSYTDNFSAALTYVDHWLCISDAVRADFLKIAENLKFGKPSSETIPLGADFTKMVGEGKTQLSIKGYGQYILSVGTIEPRKNHEAILDAFDAALYEDEKLNIVFVGRQGWNVSDLVSRIQQHPSLNKRIFWIQDATDNDVSVLYEHAFISLNLSHYEGFGLPVVESLSHDCVAVCRGSGAMEEVAQGAAYCIESEATVDSIVNAIRHLTQPDIYAEYKQKSADFVAPTWSAAVEKIITSVESISQTPEDFLYSPKQVVYISIRPDALHLSLSLIVKNMKFISEAIVLTADSFFDVMQERLQGLSLDVLIIKESELGINVDNLPKDHQVRNTFLRRRLYRHEKVDPNFIACDDDNHAIKKVSITSFVDQGRHIGYYFDDDSREWLGAYPKPTSFDEGVWKTSQYLQGAGYETKLYNSHQPQIINKNICGKIFNRTKGLGLDEWSIYFNIAKHLYPDLYKQQLYRAIGWPQHFTGWMPISKPTRILFENFYEEDKKISQTAMSKVREYSKGYDAWYALQNSISPSLRMLEIIISHSGVTFPVDEIECIKGAKIFIKVKVKGNITRFNMISQYADARNRRVFDFHSIPRFLYVNTATVTSNKHVDFNIAVDFPENEKEFKLKLPIIFKAS